MSEKQPGNNRQILILTSEIAEAYGGLTGSLLAKARWFSLVKGWSSKILTFNFNANYESVIENLYRDDKITRQTSVININAFFEEISDASETLNKPLTTEQVRTTLVNTNSERIKSVPSSLYNYGSDNIYNLDGKRLRRYVYDTHGRVHKIIFYDEDGHMHKEDFVNGAGNVYQTRVHVWNSRSESHDLKLIQLNLDGHTYEFSTFRDFQHYFVNFIVNQKLTFAMAETRAMDPMLLTLNNPNVKTIYMVHNPHIRPGTTIVRAGNRPVLNDLNKIDAYLLLTERQRHDIVERYGHRSNYFAINHPIEGKKITQEKNHTIVMLTRLDYQKRLEHAVKIMALVHAKRPDLKLEIYGKGDKESQLKQMISEYHLEDTVFLRGHSHEAQNVVQRAMFSLITSRYEGFPLAVQESLANGTPVISYDIKYGPADMISDGVNGYLVKEGDIQTFADRIISLSDDTVKQQEMSKAAIEMTKRYAPDVFVGKWENLFNSIEGIQTGGSVQDIEATVSRFDVTSAGISVAGFLNLTGNETAEERPVINVRVIDRASRAKDPEHFNFRTLNLELKNDSFSFTIPRKILLELQKTVYLDVELTFENGKFYKDVPLKMDNDLSTKKLTTYGVVNFAAYKVKDDGRLRINVKPVADSLVSAKLHQI